MSLYRQLMIIFTTVILTIFVGNFISNISSTREFLRHQLHSNANDTATSLGLALKPYLAKNDRSAMTSMVDIVFDRGYHQSIILYDMEKKPVIKREIPVTIKDTPAWFVSMFPLTNKKAKASITANWSYSGIIEVKSHPGFAYATFWQNTLEDFYWSLFSFSISFMITAIILHRTLRSLKQIEMQAKRICQKDFVVLHNIPRTREFARITHAMNQLSAIVENTFNELIGYSEHMRQEAYSDPESGLYNRRRFIAVVEKALVTGSKSQAGFIVEIELENYKSTTETWSCELKTEFTKLTASAIEAASETSEGAIIARVAKGVFRVLLPSANALEAAVIAKNLHETIGEKVEDKQLTINIAAVPYVTGDKYEALNELLEDTLSDCRQTNGHEWKIYQRKDIQNQDWEASLDNLLASQDVCLVSQSIRACDRSGELYREILARVKAEDGSLISASTLLPIARKLGKIQDFDKMVLQKTISYLQEPKNQAISVGVNISFQSLHDKEFLAWMLGALIKRPEIAERIIIEISIHDIQENYNEALSLIKRARLLGCQLAIEHFGNGLDGFDHLNEIKPQYIKIDGSYVRGISEDKDNQYFVHSITQAAHSLKIKVIAECTENEPDILTLRNLNVDGAQGYLMGLPQPLIEEAVL